MDYTGITQFKTDTCLTRAINVIISRLAEYLRIYAKNNYFITILEFFFFKMYSNSHNRNNDRVELRLVPNDAEFPRVSK